MSRRVAMLLLLMTLSEVEGEDGSGGLRGWHNNKERVALLFLIGLT